VWEAFVEGATVLIDDGHVGALFSDEALPLPGADEGELPAGLRFFGGVDAEGEVAVIPDPTVLTSSRLAEPGHAEVVAELARALPPGAVIAIVRHVAGMNLLQVVLGPGLPA